MVPSIVRTVVPYIVGYIIYIVGVAILRFTGTEVDLSGLSNFLEQMLVVALSALYYWVARWLERNKNSKWGWLLGSNKQPVYGNEVQAVIPAPEAPNTIEADPTYSTVPPGAF